MKNIAILLTTTGWGGLEMNTLKLALGFSEKGYPTTLICTENSKLHLESKGKLANTIEIKQPKKYFDFKAAKLIASLLKANNIDTVLIPDNRDIDVLAWTKRLHYRNVKIVYHQNMQIGINKRDLIHTYRFKAIDTWITPLSWLKEEVVKNTRFPEDWIKVIPIGTEIKRFTQNNLSKTEARKLLNIKTSSKLLGIIGRISEKKGQEFIIQAISQLRKIDVDIELLVFGSATINDAECQAYEKRVKKFVADNKLTDVVHFREFSPQVEQFYSAVDIFTIASESETYGMVTIEAMLSKLPIIAANTGGSPEILDQGKLGKLYRYNNADSFIEKIQEIITNSTEAEKMVQDAYNKAIKEYSHVTEINRILELID